MIEEMELSIAHILEKYPLIITLNTPQWQYIIPT